MSIGRPSYRRGAKKTSDFKIGVINGKPSMQVNWGGRIYGTQLSLLGSGGIRDSLDVSNIRATGNITFGKNSSVYNNSNRLLMVGGITVKGDDNIAIGTDTVLSSLQNGATNNIGIGAGTGKNITTGIANVCMGIDCGDALVGGISNVCIGTEAGSGTSDDSLSSGNLNVSIGHQSGRLQSSTGVKTVDDLTPTPSAGWQINQTHVVVQGVESADGESLSCTIVTDGSGNPTFILDAPGSDYIVDEEIVFTDPGSTSSTATLVVATLTGTISPIYSVFSGYLAGGGLRAADGSVGIGAYALAAGGTYNIGLGYQAGWSPSTLGSKNILIGYQASVSDVAAINQVVLGNSITCTANNTTVIGNTSIILDAGGDIELDAAADINIPANIGLTFGDDGEKIEGDGTHLTIDVSGTLKINTNKILVTSTESTDTTPYPELQLYRNADVQDTGVDSTYGTIGVIYFMGLNSAGGKETYGYLRCIIEDDANGSEDATIQIGTKNDGGVSDIVYIRDDRVGINIAPSYSLDVYTATSGYAAAFRNDGSNANRKGIAIQCGVDGASSQGDCVYIDFFDGDATAAGGVRCGSTVANPEFFNGSDIRIKENIIDTKIDALSLLNKLQFREYTYKNNGIKDEIGLIAQEVEPILPQMVSKMNANGYEEYLDGDTEMLALGRETLVYYMAKAVQELSAKLDNIDGRLTNLETI